MFLSQFFGFSMKFTLSALFSLLIVGSCWGELGVAPVTTDLPPSEEVIGESFHLGEEEQMLESLIALTKTTLQQQEDLLHALRDRNTAHHQFLHDRTNQKVAYRFLESSKSVLEAIQEANMEEFFRKEFLEELVGLVGITQRDDTAE